MNGSPCIERENERQGVNDMAANLGNTQYFSVKTEPEIRVKDVLGVVYTAMEEKG